MSAASTTALLATETLIVVLFVLTLVVLVVTHDSVEPGDVNCPRGIAD